jgi:nicotinamide mononucleotide transporter
MALIELVAVVFAIAYLVLAIRQNVWCWPAAIVSVVLSFVLFWDARLLMEAVLQVFYLGMGVYGWQQWLRGSSGDEGVRVHWWPMRLHLAAVAVIAVLTVGCGRLLADTDAALPYLDSFTTAAAIVTTWMVARKVIENWIYWFVIDSVSIYLYIDRGLVLYAGLFVAYLVLVVIGFRAWLADGRRGHAGA